MLENVQHDAIFKCGHLDCHGIRKCEMWGLGAEGIKTITTNVT